MHNITDTLEGYIIEGSNAPQSAKGSPLNPPMTTSWWSGQAAGLCPPQPLTPVTPPPPTSSHLP